MLKHSCFCCGRKPWRGPFMPDIFDGGRRQVHQAGHNENAQRKQNNEYMCFF